MKKVPLKPLVSSVRHLLAPVHRLALWDRHTHRHTHTHSTSTVTLAAHARWGLIKNSYMCVCYKLIYNLETRFKVLLVALACIVEFAMSFTSCHSIHYLSNCGFPLVRYHYCCHWLRVDNWQYRDTRSQCKHQRASNSFLPEGGWRVH